MNKRKNKTKKGSVLLVTILVSFLLSISAISIYTIVYRYTNSITSRINELREQVYDNGQFEIENNNTTENEE